MNRFSLSFLLATFVAGVNAGGCKNGATFTEPAAPTEVIPKRYVHASGGTLDQQVCGDHHLVDFTLTPSIFDSAIIGAKLTIAAFDVDNVELRMVLIDGTPLGYMTVGGDSCWSVSEFNVDVPLMLNLTLSHNYTFTVDVENTSRQCAIVTWVSLEMEYTSGVFGDPHFATWSGEKYDFHGVCDLVLLHAPFFGNNAGMDIHIRTKQTRQWSYISAVALRIGEDTLEVMGGENTRYWINGEAGEQSSDDSLAFPESISGHPIFVSLQDQHSQKIVIDLGEGAKLVIKTWNSYVSIAFKGANEKIFDNSVGLMGTFPEGKKLGRDGITVIDSLESFGQEWQVLATEDNLFHNKEGPQAPSTCEIPSNAQMRHRLGESLITKEDAEIACSRVSIDSFDLCVFDVVATNDKDAAGAY